ncbi:MAG: hypothetical protein E4H20_08575 [Spirochaetales bacterium]|nr:MAG: hypothetical protein E4H20_08575 [Spirochaetales bacterium]
MRRRMFLAVLALLVFTTSGFAQTPDFLSTGAWEFGGSLIFVHRPDAPVFASDVSDDDRGSYDQTLDLSVTIGKFLSDRLSLSLRPSFFWYKSLNLNASLENLDQSCIIGLGLEPSYYISFSPTFLMSLGAELGIGMQPGLMGLSNGDDDPNESLSVNFWLEPKVAGYYMVSERMAGFAQLGFKLIYTRFIKNSDGSSYSYSSDYSMFDDVLGRLNVTLGLKYFLPQGGRFPAEGEYSFNDFIDNENK